MHLQSTASDWHDRINVSVLATEIKISSANLSKRIESENFSKKINLFANMKLSKRFTAHTKKVLENFSVF